MQTNSIGSHCQVTYEYQGETQQPHHFRKQGRPRIGPLSEGRHPGRRAERRARVESSAAEGAASLRRCLEKDPKRRLRDIADAMALIEDVTPAALPPAKMRYMARCRVRGQVTHRVSILNAEARWTQSIPESLHRTSSQNSGCKFDGEFPSRTERVPGGPSKNAKF